MAAVAQMIRFFYALGSGAHLERDMCRVIPVHAFRLEPVTRGGHTVVDGELVEDAPVQAVATNYAATVCTSARPTTTTDD